MLFNFLSKDSRLPALFIVPVLWVTLEFIRSYALTGFPWALLGYSQYKFLPLIQIADITGVYGVSFLISALNGMIFDVAIYWPKKVSEMPLFARWPLTVGILIYMLIMIASLVYGTWGLKSGESEQKIRVGVIQGNIEQDKKWDPGFREEVMKTYKRLSINASTASPDLIVWPETALPFIFDYDRVPTKQFLAFQRELGIYLLFGSVRVKEIKASRPLLANSAILLSPKGDITSIYDKIHLVPYGEYIPLKRLFPYLRKIVPAIGDFESGKEYTIMDTPFAKIGPLICYEIIFPGLVRKFVDKGADVLVTITNDAWFGKTSAPYQHFTMAVFRAIENRTPVVRAANTGISGFIDTKGRIKKKSDIFVKTTLIDDISIGYRRSFYTKFGDLFAFLCIITFVLLIANKIYPERGKGF